MSKWTVMLAGFALCASLGCVEDGRYYGGGYIMYDYPKDLPEVPPDCGPVTFPVDEDPVDCYEYSRGECCYWLEQMLYPHGTKMSMCRFDWCYDKWECEWQHILSKCESVE